MIKLYYHKTIHFQKYSQKTIFGNTDNQMCFLGHSQNFFYFLSYSIYYKNNICHYIKVYSLIKLV